MGCTTDARQPGRSGGEEVGEEWFVVANNMIMDISVSVSKDMTYHEVALLLIAACLLIALRIYWVLPPRIGPRRRQDEKCSLGIFLGSGGHTSEMRALLHDINLDRYSPRTYVYCTPDEISLRTIAEVEAKTQMSDEYSIVALPRARHVGEGLASTAVSTIRALIVAARTVVLRPLLKNPSKPWVDVLVINGPGTCVVLVLLSYVRRILGLSYTRIIYVESFARVSTLSLSGKLVRPFVDIFVVQWPGAAGSSSSRAEVRGMGRPDERSVVKGIPAICRGWLV